MLIRYDGSGNINAATIDSFPLEGATIVTLADNADVLAHPGKYTYISSVLARREYLVLTTTAPLVDGIPTVAADGVASIPVTITAYNSAGAVDTTATFAVTLTDIRARSLESVTVTLTSGIGSASYTSATAKRMMLSARAANTFGGSLAIAFA